MSKLRKIMDDLKGNKKNGRNNSNLITNLIAVAALIISILSWTSLNYPSLIPGNTDYISRANKGDIGAQIFLADHYYMIADYENAMYWYKIASMGDKKNSVAKSNLAYMYSNKIGVNKDYPVIKNDVIERLYRKAITTDPSNKAIIKNYYAFKIKNDVNATDSKINNKNLIQTLNEYYEKDPSIVTCLKMKFPLNADDHEALVSYEFVDTRTGIDVPANTSEYYYETISSDYIYKDNDSFQWIVTYNVYKLVSTDIKDRIYNFFKEQYIESN